MSKVIQIHETGGPEVLKIEDKDVRAPDAGEIRVNIEAIGLNRAEVMFRKGTYLEETKFPASLGYEASAIVDAVGKDVTNFKPGDSVSVIPAFSLNEYGVYAEQAVVPAHAVVKRPANLTAVESAAVWMQYLTAWGALVDIAKVRKDDYVIIPAASSSVGLAAIQIVNSVGGISIATTRTSAKVKALQDAGAKYVIVTDEQDLVEEVNRISNNKGARIAFDPVAGEQVQTLAEAISVEGMIFIYGNLNEAAVTPFPLGPALLKGLTLRGYTLFEITSNPERLKQGHEFITKGLASGDLKPLVAKTFPLEEIVAAHQYMESNQQIGKIVVTVN